MLTRDGRAVLVLAVLAAGVGRVLGVPELLVVGATLGLLLALVAVLVHARRLRLQVSREVRPTKVHVGADSRIELTAVNRARRRTPPLRLHDRVQGARGATLLLAPLGAGGSATSTYRLPTDRRGVRRIGPLDVVLGDPFGLVEARTQAAAVDQLTVLPAVEAIVPPPMAPGDEPHQASRASRTLAPSGGDLHSLRPYVVGDDLRRVHWRSTARHGDLLVRVDEQPWQGRTTVLLDARQATNTAASLELAISAAASVLTAARGRGDGVRLLRMGRRSVPGLALGNAEADALIEELAALEPDPDESLSLSVRSLGPDRVGGTLVVVSSGVGRPDEHGALAPLRPRFGRIVSVRFDASTWGDGAARAAPMPGVDVAVEVTSGRPFPVAWNSSVGSARRR